MPTQEPICNLQCNHCSRRGRPTCPYSHGDMAPDITSCDAFRRRKINLAKPSDRKPRKRKAVMETTGPTSTQTNMVNQEDGGGRFSTFLLIFLALDILMLIALNFIPEESPDWVFFLIGAPVLLVLLALIGYIGIETYRFCRRSRR